MKMSYGEEEGRRWKKEKEEKNTTERIMWHFAKKAGWISAVPGNKKMFQLVAVLWLINFQYNKNVRKFFNS